MVLTFPAAYHNRNVIFFSLIVYIALFWLINFSSSSTREDMGYFSAGPSCPELLLCDIMRKCGLCGRPVSISPSVCPSVTLLHCIQTADPE